MDYECNSKHKITLVMSFQLKNLIAFQNDQYWKTTFAHNSSTTLIFNFGSNLNVSCTNNYTYKLEILCSSTHSHTYMYRDVHTLISMQT